MIIASDKPLPSRSARPRNAGRTAAWLRGIVLPIALGGSLLAAIPVFAQDVVSAALEAYRRGDAQAAVDILLPAAKGDDAEAQYTLAVLLESAFAQPAEAATWYVRAAVRGHAAAQNNLGALHYDGRGVRQDFALARSYYLAAAKQGYAIAQYNLALMLGTGKGGERDEAGMHEWLRRAAGAGYDRAEAQLGRLHLEGIGVPASASDALGWFHRAAANGNADAQYFLGSMLQKGQGAPRDLAAARQWLEQSADQGHVDAVRELARSQEMGLGLPSEPARALVNYRRAAESGDAASIERMIAVYEKGELGEKPDAARARFWRLRQGAAGGESRPAVPPGSAAAPQAR